MKKTLIVGGANGIGLSIATVLANMEETEKIFIIDKVDIAKENLHQKFEFHQFDLTESDYSIFDYFNDIDSLIITAGFGRLELFENIPEELIVKYFNVNTIPVIRIIKRFYEKLCSNGVFYCGVMVSIAGYLSSPFFSLYGATKAALRIFIESVNVELEKAGSSNRILNISPGYIQGTSFYSGKTDLLVTRKISEEIITHLTNREDLFIPNYDSIYKGVLERYNNDFREEGRRSYDYKLKRINEKK